MHSPHESPTGARPPRRLRRLLLRRFTKDRRGVAAVEFGLVAMPFFAVLFAILEVALAFWTGQVLETLVSNASRQIYTGQFQQANAGRSTAEMAEAFKNLICGDSAGLFDCDGKLKVDVRTYASFPGPITAPVTDGRMDTNGWGYRDSRPLEIVVVRAAFEHPVFTSFIGHGTLANGNRLIMATATFRNEPFQ